MKTALGVQLEEKVARLVLVGLRGRHYELLGTARLSRGEGNDFAAELSLQLGSLLSEAGARLTYGAIGLPGSGCSIKTAELPPAKPAELAQVAQFEAQSQFPLPLEEMVWDFTTTLLPEGGYHAVIAGVRRSLADQSLDLLTEMGVLRALLLPVPLVVASVAALPAGSHLLICAEGDSTDICLYEGGLLRGCRSLRSGSPETPAWSTRVLREMRPWLAGEGRAQSLLVLGNVPTETQRAWSAELGLPVESPEVWASVQDPAGKLRRLEEAPAAYATALALAQAALQPQWSLNLLPPTVKHAHRQQERLVRTAAVLGVACALLLPVSLASGRLLGVRRQEAAEVSRALQEVQGSKGTAPSAAVWGAYQALEGLRQPQSQPLDLLGLLSTRLPGGITLSDLAYDRDKATLSLTGYADSETAVAAAVAALSKGEGIQEAVLEQATAVKSDAVKGYDFRISCKLATTKDPTLAAERARARKTTPKGETL